MNGQIVIKHGFSARIEFHQNEKMANVAIEAHNTFHKFLTVSMNFIAR